jgi:hypothetical protein
MNGVTLEIKLNNAASNDPCEVCGARTDPETGPELFLAGSWGLVCYECGDEHAPELVRCLSAYRSARTSGDERTYVIPEPYTREVRELVNTLDGERQEIALSLGTEHPLFKLVDGALRGDDIEELQVAYVAARGWPRVGSAGALPN